MNRQDCGGNISVNISPGITRNGPSSDLTEENLDDLKIELTKVEDEIQTLRQVLLTKEKYAMDIRSQLGMTPLSTIKHNLAKGWQDVQTSAPYMTAASTLEDISHSNAYKRTQESFSYAGQVTSAALSTVGVTITRRLADMRPMSISVPAMRPSSTFRSLEEMVGSVKEKVTGGRGNDGNTSGFEKRSSLRGSRDRSF